MLNSNTEYFNFKDVISEVTLEKDFRKICSCLEEKGYNINNQLVGYMLSRDPSYITNYGGARKIIQNYDVEQLLDFLVSYYLEKEGF